VPADQRTQVVEALQHLVAALDALPASPVTSNEGDPE